MKKYVKKMLIMYLQMVICIYKKMYNVYGKSKLQKMLLMYLKNVKCVYKNISGAYTKFIMCM